MYVQIYTHYSVILLNRDTKYGDLGYFTIKTSGRYFECDGETFVSDSDSVLNRGIESIISSYLKLGLVLPISIMRMGIGSRFCYSVSKYES